MHSVLQVTSCLSDSLIAEIMSLTAGVDTVHRLLAIVPETTPVTSKYFSKMDTLESLFVKIFENIYLITVAHKFGHG